MKRNIFGLWLLVVGLVFAALTLGGCGGSSSNRPSIETDDSNLTMSDVWNIDEAMDEVVNRLTSADLFKMWALRMEFIERKADSSVTMRYVNALRYVISDEKYPEVPYNKDELLAHYESGDIIVIGEADQSLVNTVRSDLGLSSEDADTFGESGILEIYGLSCQRVNGLRNLFHYIIPKMGDLMSNDAFVPDASTEEESTNENPTQGDDGQPEKNEVIPEAFSMRELQIERWVRFLQWMGNVSVEALRNEASAAQIRAANEELAHIADAQTKTFDFTHPHTIDMSDWGGGLYTVSRTNTVSYTIYTAHSQKLYRCIRRIWRVEA